MLSRFVGTSLIVASLGVVGLGAAAAANPPAGFGWRGGLASHNGPFARLIMGKIGRLMVLKSEMGVTDEQRAKLRTIGLAHRSEVGPALKQLSGTFRSLRDSVLAENADEATIRKAAEAHGKAVGDVAVALSHMAKEGREVLTAEQREQIKTFITQNDTAADKIHQEMKEKLDQLK